MKHSACGIVTSKVKNGSQPVSFTRILPTPEIYHTVHFFSGFILEPTGQLKSCENSSMFDNGPRTRNSPGLWKPVVIRSFNASGRYLLHQELAALIQNNCSGLYGRPGNFFSGLFRLTHSLYA